MTGKPLLAPAVETAEPQGTYHRYWWLAIIASSLAGWAVVIAGMSLLASLRP